MLIVYDFDSILGCSNSMFYCGVANFLCSKLVLWSLWWPFKECPFTFVAWASSTVWHSIYSTGEPLFTPDTFSCYFYYDNIFFSSIYTRGLWSGETPRLLRVVALFVFWFICMIFFIITYLKLMIINLSIGIAVIGV